MCIRDSNTVVAYVQDCRPLLNQGQYNLPEPPKLADFDQTLQAVSYTHLDVYKRQSQLHLNGQKFLNHRIDCPAEISTEIGRASCRERV